MIILLSDKPEDHQPTTTKRQVRSDKSERINSEETPLLQNINIADQVQMSQSFIPSFAPFHSPPLGHSRPYFYQPEAAYSHRPGYHRSYNYDPSRFSGYKGEISPRASSSDQQNILGSGNFGVIRGGTFYNDNDANADDYESRIINPYYQNGHGRPSYYMGNPKPRQEEQFANFRDFADINAPSNPAYSQFVVVYANKNGTKKDVRDESRPRNIIEHLEMLDKEKSSEAEIVPKKKLSKSKRKLAMLRGEKKVKQKKIIKTETIYTPEPLLALS